MAFIAYFCRKKRMFMVNKKNPFASRAKQVNEKRGNGKRVGKSKPDKANNQLNRRVK